MPFQDVRGGSGLSGGAPPGGPEGPPWRCLEGKAAGGAWSSLEPLEVPLEVLEFLETPGGPRAGPWRPLEAPGGPWRPLEAPGGPWRPLEAPGGPWRPLEAPGGPWRPLEARLRRASKILLIQETEIKLVLHFQFR